MTPELLYANERDARRMPLTAKSADSLAWTAATWEAQAFDVRADAAKAQREWPFGCLHYPGYPGVDDAFCLEWWAENIKMGEPEA